MRRHTMPTRTRVLHAVRNGQSMKAVAWTHDVEYVTVHRWCQEAGVRSQARAGAPFRYDAATRADALARIARGERITAVARSIGAARATVRYWEAA